MTPIDRPAVIQAASFWSRVDRRGDDECWPWKAGKNAHGYGRVYVAGKSTAATRIAWELANGRPFPADKLACHACDNPPCCNPAHIWPGTQSDNLKDCVAKGRHLSRPMSHCQRGHLMDAANRKPTTGGWRCATCFRESCRINSKRYRDRRRAANG